MNQLNRDNLTPYEKKLIETWAAKAMAAHLRCNKEADDAVIAELAFDTAEAMLYEYRMRQYGPL